MCCRLSVVWMLIPADIVLLCVCKIIDRYEHNKLNAVASHMPTHSRCKDTINQSKHRGKVCNLGQRRGNAHEQKAIFQSPFASVSKWVFIRNYPCMFIFMQVKLIFIGWKASYGDSIWNRDTRCLENGDRKGNWKLTFPALALRGSESRDCELCVVYIRKDGATLLVGAW